MDKNYTIQEAKPEDAAGIVEVKRITWLDTYPNEEYGVTREDIESKFSDIQKRIDRQAEYLVNPLGSKTWVAKDGEKVVGMSVATLKEGIRHVAALYVLPEYHGKKIGAALMQTAMEWLGTHNVIFVNVARYNDSSIKFYEKFGFVKTRDIPPTTETLASGASIPETEMVRQPR